MPGFGDDRRQRRRFEHQPLLAQRGHDDGLDLRRQPLAARPTFLPQQCADAAIKSVRRVEHVYRSAMSALLRVDDPREVMAWREVYRRLSRIGDHIHGVAERVWYAMMKEA